MDRSSFLLLVVLLSAGIAIGQTTAFTYQGQLTNAGQLASGSFDLQFGLFDSVSAGTQIGSTQTVSAVSVSGGVFTVQLDFGTSAFPGANRFLEIGVRPAGGGSFTTLTPRQQISSTPYAIRTLSAATADALSSACVGCVQSAQINAIAGSKLTGTIPVASLPTGSGSYIQNTTTQQAGANFNIGGNGTIGGNLTVAGMLNANVSGNFIQNRTTQQSSADFNISGNGTLGGTLSANTVGVGTTSPGTALDVRGGLTLDGGGDPVLYTGTATQELNRYLDLINSPASPSASGLKAGGILVADSYSYASPGKNDLIVKGNAGIGTTAPESKFHIAGRAGLVSGPFRGVTIDQTITPVSDLSGYTFQVRTTTQSGISATTATDFLIDSVGNVGVATSTPPHRLSVSGGPGWTSNGWLGAMGLDNASAIGWQGNAAGWHFGIGQTDGGLFFFRTSSALGSNAAPATYDMILDDGGNFTENGNTWQPRTKGGFVKAIIYVNEDGTIARCYNSPLNGTPAGGGPCGFSVDHLALGQYNVNFGFEIDDRFYSLTVQRDSSFHANAAEFDVSSTNVISVLTYNVNGPAFTNAPFMLIVY